MNGGGSKKQTGPVSKLNTNNKDLSNKDLSKSNISSRKDESSPKELASSAGAENISIQNQSDSVGYLKPQIYNLLQGIADKYNNRVFGYPLTHYTLTHEQKMKIGDRLIRGYIFSDDVLGAIDRVPGDCKKPLAYLLSILDNLEEERKMEERIRAHQFAAEKYGMLD